jgi:hypothetical protein
VTEGRAPHAPSVDEAVASAAYHIPAVASGRCFVVSVSSRGTAVRIKKRVSVLSVTMVDKASGRVFSEDIVVKRYDGPGAPLAHAALTTLWRAGFRPPSRLRVPRPYGMSPARRQVVEQFVAGRPLIDLMRRGPINAGAAAMTWLLRLQSTELRLHKGGPDRLFALPLRGDENGIASLTMRVGRALATSADPIVPSHGDFHLKNVMVCGDTTVAIDLDKLAAREASFDVGDAMGQLLVMSHFGYGTLATGWRVAAEMWNVYRQVGRATAERTALHVARSILSSLIYKVRLARAAGESPPLLDPWLKLVRHCLVYRDPTSVCALASRLDIGR